MRVARATPPQRPPDRRHTGEVYYCGPNRTTSNGDRVVYGAKGVATGPGDSGRLEVQFEGNNGPISLESIQLSLTPPPAELLGDFTVGETTYYTGEDYTWSDGNQKVNGWRGVVVGPVMGKEDTLLAVKFEQNEVPVGILLTDLSRTDPKVRLRRGRWAGASLRLAPRSLSHDHTARPHRRMQGVWRRSVGLRRRRRRRRSCRR